MAKGIVSRPRRLPTNLKGITPDVIKPQNTKDLATYDFAASPKSIPTNFYEEVIDGVNYAVYQVDGAWYKTPFEPAEAEVAYDNPDINIYEEFNINNQLDKTNKFIKESKNIEVNDYAPFDVKELPMDNTNLGLEESNNGFRKFTGVIPPDLENIHELNKNNPYTDELEIEMLDTDIVKVFTEDEVVKRKVTQPDGREAFVEHLYDYPVGALNNNLIKEGDPQYDPNQRKWRIEVEAENYEPDPKNPLQTKATLSRNTSVGGYLEDAIVEPLLQYLRVTNPRAYEKFKLWAEDRIGEYREKLGIQLYEPDELISKIYVAERLGYLGQDVLNIFKKTNLTLPTELSDILDSMITQQKKGRANIETLKNGPSHIKPIPVSKINLEDGTYKKDKRIRYSLKDMGEEDRKKMVSSGRAGGFIGKDPVAWRHASKLFEKTDRVLDYGAGKNARQTKKYLEEGYDVTAWDLPENQATSVHFPEALRRRYDYVVASNVLNVQPNPSSVKNVLDEIYNVLDPGGKVVVNFPSSPRNNNLTPAGLEKLLHRIFTGVQKVDGTSSSPVYEATRRLSLTKTTEDIAESLNKVHDVDYKDDDALVNYALAQAMDDMVKLFSDPTFRFNDQLEWYRDEVAETMDIVSLEKGMSIIKEKPEYELLLKALMGITSQGLAPIIQYQYSVESFKEYVATGKFTYVKNTSGNDILQSKNLNGELKKVTNFTSGKFVAGNAKRIEALISEFGMKGAMKWLLTPMTGYELRAWNKANGFPLPSVAKQKIHYGARMFGPKIGRYTLALMGIDGEAVYDLWMTRQWRRWTGNMFKTDAEGNYVLKKTKAHPEGKKEIADAPTARERKIMDRVYNRLAEILSKEFNYPFMKLQCQALNWEFEKVLWESLGQEPELSVNYKNAAIIRAERKGYADEYATSKSLKDATEAKVRDYYRSDEGFKSIKEGIERGGFRKTLKKRYSLKLNKSNTDLEHYDPLEIPIFYSKLEQVVARWIDDSLLDESKAPTLKANQLFNKLIKMGVKKTELDYIGLEDWLKRYYAKVGGGINNKEVPLQTLERFIETQNFTLQVDTYYSKDKMFSGMGMGVERRETFEPSEARSESLVEENIDRDTGVPTFLDNQRWTRLYESGSGNISKRMLFTLGASHKVQENMGTDYLTQSSDRSINWALISPDDFINRWMEVITLGPEMPEGFNLKVDGKSFGEAYRTIGAMKDGPFKPEYIKFKSMPTQAEFNKINLENPSPLTNHYRYDGSWAKQSIKIPNQYNAIKKALAFFQISDRDIQEIAVKYIKLTNDPMTASKTTNAYGSVQSINYIKANNKFYPFVTNHTLKDASEIDLQAGKNPLKRKYENIYKFQDSGLSVQRYNFATDYGFDTLDLALKSIIEYVLDYGKLQTGHTLLDYKMNRELMDIIDEPPNPYKDPGYDTHFGSSVLNLRTDFDARIQLTQSSDPEYKLKTSQNVMAHCRATIHNFHRDNGLTDKLMYIDEIQSDFYNAVIRSGLLKASERWRNQYGNGWESKIINKYLKNSSLVYAQNLDKQTLNQYEQDLIQAFDLLKTTPAFMDNELHILDDMYNNPKLVITQIGKYTFEGQEAFMAMYATCLKMRSVEKSLRAFVSRGSFLKSRKDVAQFAINLDRHLGSQGPLSDYESAIGSIVKNNLLDTQDYIKATLKRALRLAADQGVTHIAVTPGFAQNLRYYGFQSSAGVADEIILKPTLQDGKEGVYLQESIRVSFLGTSKKFGSTQEYNPSFVIRLGQRPEQRLDGLKEKVNQQLKDFNASPELEQEVYEHIKNVLKEAPTDPETIQAYGRPDIHMRLKKKHSTLGGNLDLNEFIYGYGISGVEKKNKQMGLIPGQLEKMLQTSFTDFEVPNNVNGNFNHAGSDHSTLTSAEAKKYANLSGEGVEKNGKKYIQAIQLSWTDADKYSKPQPRFSLKPNPEEPDPPKEIYVSQQDDIPNWKKDALTITRENLNQVKKKKGFLKDLLAVSDTRLKLISPNLESKLRKFEYDIGVETDEVLLKLVDIKQKVLDNLSKTDRLRIELAMLNSDENMVVSILEQLPEAKQDEAFKAIDSYRAALDDIHSRALNAGYDIGFRNYYFPRQIKDLDGLLAHINNVNKVDMGIINQAIVQKQRDIGRSLDEQEKAAFISNLIRGYNVIGGKPGNLKGRRLEYVDMEMYEAYYEDFLTANYKYINSIIPSVRRQEFFGKGEENMDDIGSAVARWMGQPKSQEQIVKETLEESLNPLTIKEVKEKTDILEPNVRRILGQGAKTGVFERVDRGVYTIITEDGKNIAYVETGDALEVLPKLVKGGKKYDMLFLDPAYFSKALIGGNRGIKSYEFMYAPEFKEAVKSLVSLLKDEDSHCYLMLSGAKTAQDDMLPYLQAMDDYGLKVVGEGEWKKLFKNGNPVTNVRGKEAAAERIFLFTKSGKAREGEESLDNLNFRFVRPPVRKSYQTEKAPELLEALIKNSTLEGESVLDPFAGSGVTGEQAIVAGREPTLIEKSDKAIEEHILPKIRKASQIAASDKFKEEQLNQLIPNNITPEQQQEIIDILRARFNQRAAAGFIAPIKNTLYMMLMGKVTSAVTQLGDLAWTYHIGGLTGGTKALVQTLIRQQILTKEDLGIERIAAEFVEISKTGKALDLVFKSVGLTAMDRIGKETLCQAAYDKMRKQAKKIVSGKNNFVLDEQKKRNFYVKLLQIFESEKAVDLILKDLAEGKITEDIKFLMFCELCNFQPITLSQMPKKYLDSPNGRIAYQLKTFTLKQFDVYRREGTIRMANAATLISEGKKRKEEGERTGNKEKTEEGKRFIKEGIKEYSSAMANIIRLLTIFWACDFGAGTTKDFIMGREIDLKQNAIDSFMRLFGVSRYILWTGRQEKWGRAILEQFSPFGTFLSVEGKFERDLKKKIKIWKGEATEQETYYETPNLVPVVDWYTMAAGAYDKWAGTNYASKVPAGKTYYWWFGNGKKNSIEREIKGIIEKSKEGIDSYEGFNSILDVERHLNIQLSDLQSMHTMDDYDRKVKIKSFYNNLLKELEQRKAGLKGEDAAVYSDSDLEMLNKIVSRMVSIGLMSTSAGRNKIEKIIQKYIKSEEEKEQKRQEEGSTFKELYEERD